MTQGLVADHFTTETCQIRPGDVAVVLAAAGGGGTASGRGAAQIADPLIERGPEVVGPAGRLENRHAALDAR
jgi:NADPH-dependent curcumin reductase CurA